MNLNYWGARNHGSGINRWKRSGKELIWLRHELFYRTGRDTESKIELVRTSDEIKSNENNV